MNLLGIDVGTGGTRVVLLDGDGFVVSSATTAHPPFASHFTSRIYKGACWCGDILEI
jgi:sugar (pentulose or hexulose) kinase